MHVCTLKVVLHSIPDRYMDKRSDQGVLAYAREWATALGLLQRTAGGVQGAYGAYGAKGFR